MAETLVMAHTLQQAQEWARDNRLESREWRMLTELRHLLGRWGGEVVVLRGAQEHRRHHDLIDCALRHRMTVRYAERESW